MGANGIYGESLMPCVVVNENVDFYVLEFLREMLNRRRVADVQLVHIDIVSDCC